MQSLQVPEEVPDAVAQGRSNERGLTVRVEHAIEAPVSGGDDGQGRRGRLGGGGEASLVHREGAAQAPTPPHVDLEVALEPAGAALEAQPGRGSGQARLELEPRGLGGAPPVALLGSFVRQQTHRVVAGACHRPRLLPRLGPVGLRHRGRPCCARSTEEVSRWS